MKITRMLLNKYIPAILLLWCWSTSAYASGYQQPATILRYYVTVEIQNNQSIIEQTYTARVDREGAINYLGNRRISFSPKMEKVEILEAYSIDPLGIKHLVPDNAIQTQEQSVTATAPNFSDYKYKVVIFPKVGVGSVVHLKHRMTITGQLFKNFSFGRHEIYPNLIYKDVQFKLTHPANEFIDVKGRGVKGGKINGPSGKISYLFTHHQPVALEPEIAAVDSSDYAPLFSYSSRKNRLQLGWDYEKGAARKLVVTPQIKSIAMRETKGLTSRREKIDALYRWVVKNIRYVSVIIDRSGVIPNHTEEILTRGYGDCKDLSNLLWALLKAVDVEASPALINLGDSYNVEGPATISPFNHVILHLPVENLYLDPTAKTLRPGDMYPEIAGKVVVLSTLGKYGKTPDLSPDTNQLIVNVDLEIDGKGKVKGRSVETAMGDAETDLRNWALKAQSSSKEKNVLALLKGAREQGVGGYDTPDPLDLKVPFKVTSWFNLEPSVNMPGPAGWKIPQGLASSRIRDIAITQTPESRRTPFVCGSAIFIERYQIRFPKTLKILSYPTDTTFTGKYLSYKGTYKKTADNAFSVERKAVKNYGKSVCGKEEYEEFKMFQSAIKKDLRSQFIY
jgi:transglutaminase-like putative cysteine protease